MRTRNPLLVVAVSALAVASVVGGLTARHPAPPSAPSLSLSPAATGNETLGATVTERAERAMQRPGTEVVSVFEATGLSTTAEAMAHEAARSVGAAAATGRSASVALTRVSRGNQVVQAAPVGWQYPMGLTVLPPDAAAWLMGPEVGAVLTAGDIVMGRTSADLRGAQAGDVVHLLAANGTAVTFRIGLVADDPTIGSTELLVNNTQADRLGVFRRSRVVIWGFPSRQAIEAALAEYGLVDRRETRLRYGWHPADPDSTIGMAATKAQLGEFVYRLNADGTITLPLPWIHEHISGGGIKSTFSDIPIRATCHNVVRPAIQAALTEIAEAGLASAIDVSNTNSYGGCFTPRFNRLSGSVGFLSRHTWGMALDMNTVTNAQGTVPQMHCGVVHIFRKHGFAWGGNFTRPDGMHFEWVGEPRHLRQYPSTYCPNPVPLNIDEGVYDGPTERDVLFAGDGFESGHSHA